MSKHPATVIAAALAQAELQTGTQPGEPAAGRTSLPHCAPSDDPRAETKGTLLRVSGVVQGVGFRPTVWRLAGELGIRGQVLNDGSGVLIRAWASAARIDALIGALQNDPPPLARIDAISRRTYMDQAPPGFTIIESEAGDSHTGVAADAATCAACRNDTLNPFSRRYRYPFTNCTHCGPRFTIIESVPYDRGSTTMRSFRQCKQCREEYVEPRDRRFHAQPNACHACGPKAVLTRLDGRVLCTENLTQLDDVDAACTLIQRGEIVAIKGLGGFHLACDAASEQAVDTLRARKRRPAKPFALLARDLAVIRSYAQVSVQEAALLSSVEAPIVLLDTCPDGASLASGIAPAQNTLGFMLPSTPLHHLLVRRMDRPIVFTSGNQADSPQCIDDMQVREQLGPICDYLLTHNRDIVTRVDDSVTRVVAGRPRLLRRGRGYAPASLPLPAGFEKAPDLLALGGELKNTFCMLKDGQAILSQHMGDLADVAVFDDYLRNLRRYGDLFDHEPAAIAIDRHPDYLSSRHGQELATSRQLPLHSIQHHHAHIAACLVDNQWPLDAGPVLGVALDGLGLGGSEGQRGDLQDYGSRKNEPNEFGPGPIELWGGEFLLADYVSCKRAGTFKPVALPGGAQAMREPWRNTYAHLITGLGWDNLAMNYAQLDLVHFLQQKPLAALQKMLQTGSNAPLASSCGRLFDAVAAAIGICRECQSYEGQAAMELEAIIDVPTLLDEDEALIYPFAIPRLLNNNLPYIEPLAMWQALLGDLILDTPAGVMAARFHKGLARAIVKMVQGATRQDGARFCHHVALSGGVFQNRTLLELVTAALAADGFTVLTHAQVPANDGGLALGQAAITAARMMNEEAD